MAAKLSWQETQALLQRLHHPTAALLAAEYDTISQVHGFLLTVLPTDDTPTTLPLPDEQYAAVMQQWCGLAGPLLSVLADQGALKQHPMAAFSAARLLGMLASCLECWSGPAADKAAERAVQLQIAQHTAGIIPVLARQMAATAATVSKATAERHRKAKQPQTALQATEAAYALSHFPQHVDIAVGLHLLSLWRSLATNWRGKVIRTCSSQGSRGKGSRGSSSSSGGGGSCSTSLQATVLPACELAVNLLRTWPPNVAASTRSSSSSSSSSRISSSGEPYNGAILRSNVTTVMFITSTLVLGPIHNELLVDTSPLSAADAKFARQLSASAAVQHLLLLQVAIGCHVVHKRQQGVSPITAKAAAAAVTGSRQLTAAAAAAEAVAVSGGGGGGGGGSKQQQQQYLSVPGHHRAVLDLLLVPADSVGSQLRLMIDSFSDFTAEAVGTVIELQHRFPAAGQHSPQVPPELCAPLHCMLAEAAALAPASLNTLAVLLVFMQTLHGIYFRAALGPSPSPDNEQLMATINAAMVGYSSTLTASLELLGPAVLHAYKNSQDSGTDAKAVIDLFGWVTVKAADTPAIQGVLTAAFRQHPFSTAAVCEAAARGAARNSEVMPQSICVFASLIRNAISTCCDAEAPPPGNSTRSTMLAAAASDSTRDALLLQFGLITTQLKYAASSFRSTSGVSGLLHDVYPIAVTLARLSKCLWCSVGMDSAGDGSSGSTISSSSSGITNSSSSSSSDVDQQVRVRMMAPWIHLCGRYLFVGGSLLLLALEEPAPATALGMDGDCLGLTEEVLVSMLAVLQRVGYQLTELQKLQPEGKCVLHGPADAAGKELLDLLAPEGKLGAARQELERVWHRWKAAAGLRAQQIAAQGQSRGSIAWARELQQLLHVVVPVQTAAALRDAGAAVCAEFPLKLCCNNPGCTSMDRAGEMLLGSSCSGCKAARYCSKACQAAAWKLGHSKVCKRITKAAAAAASGGAQ